MDNAQWCFVPTCLNSTKNTTSKWFVPIPVNPKRRELWFKAVNRNYCFNSERSTLFCCSDHFNLEEDMGSFMEKNGELVIKLKRSIVPRLKPGSSNAASQPSLSSLRMIGLKNNVASPPVASVSSPDIVCIDDNSDDDIEEVSIVTSENSNIKNTLLVQKPKASGSKGTKLGRPKGSANKASKVKDPVSQRSGPKQPHYSENMKHLFDSLRKSIPSIDSQQSLTREQILEKAIEFIVQMRTKSDKRESCMQYVMENNGELTAKIEHLEHLMALHEKNEIVLTKEIVDRRLSAVTAPRPATLPTRPPKHKLKKSH